MKFTVLGFAILFTLFWVQMWLADFINAKVNPYARSSADNLADDRNNKIKIWLVILMALFWAAFFTY